MGWDKTLFEMILTGFSWTVDFLSFCGARHQRPRVRSRLYQTCADFAAPFPHQTRFCQHSRDHTGTSGHRVPNSPFRCAKAIALLLCGICDTKAKVGRGSTSAARRNDVVRLLNLAMNKGLLQALDLESGFATKFPPDNVRC